LAKLRTNHNSENRGRSTSKSTKTKVLRSIFGFVGILILLKILSLVNVDEWGIPEEENFDSNDSVTFSDEKVDPVDKTFFPESTTGEVVHHKHYSLSYDEEHEQAEWVAYKLTEKSLRMPNVKRAKRFKDDKAVSTTSAYHNDYSHSGYTRGHLAPAGDMAFSTEAMQESFYMSNMSPQLKEFNGGIWRELEETVRDWAFDHDELYIVSGPVLKEGHIIKKIGRNEVSVPDQFYKIILDIKGRDKKAIAFLMPNEASTKPLKSYVSSIDQIEEIVDIDFFADFLDADLEKELEASTSTKGWKFDTKRFEKRVRQWNNR